MSMKLKLTSSILSALFTSSSALYSEWNAWSPCSNSCNGKQNRTRSCRTITLQPCEGKTQIRNCNASGCYPSSEVIITSAVLGALILLLLIVLIIIIIKTRKTTRSISNPQRNRESVFDFGNNAGNIQKNNDINTNDINKSNAQRTLSSTPSTASQVTYLQTEKTAEKPFGPWGEKDSDLY